MKTAIYTLPFLVYLMFAWVVRTSLHTSAVEISSVYLGQLAVFIVLFLYYVVILKTNNNRLSTGNQPRWLPLAVLCFTVATPTVMQTDQLRYIFDGINTTLLGNPYAIVPGETSAFKNVWWVPLINHPEIPTIYPPFAEVVFGISSYLNPFFWSAGELSNFSPSSLWRVEFGWSLVSGAFLAWTVYLLRGKSWHLVVTNPLFIITAVGNKHVDLILLPFIILFFKAATSKKTKSMAILSVMTASKLMPIIWIPLLTLKRNIFSTRKNLSEFLSMSAAYVLPLTLLSLIFMPNLSSMVLESGQTYAKSWRFFSVGYFSLEQVYEFLTGSAANGYYIRYSLIAAGGVWSLAVLAVFGFRLEKTTLRHSILWLMIGFYMFFPTLHPWYFLPLVLIGLPYFPIYLTPTLWPALAFVSQIYYLNSDVSYFVQYVYISTVLGLVTKDIHTLFLNLRKKTSWSKKETENLENNPSKFQLSLTKHKEENTMMTAYQEKVLRSKIAVVMPCLDEQENLHEFLPSLMGKYRVIVVDNGSKDESAAIARAYGAEVLHCRIRGYGAAVQTGVNHLIDNPNFQKFSTEALVVFDADGTSPPENIDTVCFPVLTGESDMVIAQREIMQQRAMPGHAKFGNFLQVFLIKLLTRKEYSDMGPLRAMTLSVYRRLDMVDLNWGWNVEMQMKAAVYKLRVKEIPIIYRARIHGKSKISGSFKGTLKAGSKIIYSVFYYFLIIHLKQKNQKRGRLIAQKTGTDISQEI